jgi:Tfp pilus assembly protein PilX
LIIASYVANREGSYGMEKRFGAILVVAMALTVLYGVLKLRQMQTTYDAKSPPKASK